jgi:small subunit ribosomal protein S16
LAVVIRLNIRGRKHLAFHKIIVADSRSPRDGRFIEILGHYDPLAKTPEALIQIDAERTKYWLSVGATPSQQVASLLKKAGIVRPVKQSKPKKNKKKAVAGAKAVRKVAKKKAVPQPKKVPSPKKKAAAKPKKKGA